MSVRSRKAWVLSLALAGFASASQAECTDWALSPYLGAVSSEWNERDQAGQLLVEESGRLRSAGLALSATCIGWLWTGRAEAASGDRAYLGLSNRGVRLKTVSQIEHKTLGISASSPIASHWSWQFGVDGRQVRRYIQTTSEARGYAERFSYWILSTGVVYGQPLGRAWKARAHLVMGYMPPGKMSVNLPGADPATLKLGHGRSVEWGLGLSYAPSARVDGWLWSIDWRVQSERLAAGPAELLFQGSRLVGTANQPAIRQRHETLQLSGQYRF